jgi:hypothetical protein
MRNVLTLALALLVITASSQKWVAGAALTRLLSVKSQVTNSSGTIQRLYKNALTQEILLQRGLHIRALKGLRRLDSDKKPTEAALANTTPISEAENIWKALRKWLSAENAKLQARTNVQVEVAKIWAAKKESMEQA